MTALESSPLQLQNTNLRGLSVSFFQPKKIPDSLPTSYEILLDFDILSSQDNEINFLVSLNLSVNKGRKKKLGYVIDIKVDCFFEIIESNQLDEKNIHNLKTISAISISISKIRDILSNTTQFYQLGSYNLPAIDVQKLLKDKQKTLGTKDKD